ncbi:hypothetical protein WIS52_21900 [Pseudonocardia nematodicida]|uniref:Uncharacterized protein n=1 Tax=Pseudonocardia nematodicida TaxID=1206997 RepID=A0ABV1KG18_9PSEU
MRKSLRGAIVGATLMPLAFAAPGMAFAGDEHGGDHKNKHDHGHHEDTAGSPVDGIDAPSDVAPELPTTPLDPILDMVGDDLDLDLGLPGDSDDATEAVDDVVEEGEDVLDEIDEAAGEADEAAGELDEAAGEVVEEIENALDEATEGVDAPEAPEAPTDLETPDALDAMPEFPTVDDVVAL